MRKRGPSRKDKVEAAYALLDGLLRSPKTREGLIAAVGDQFTKNFVYGYLSERIRTGSVTVLKTGDQPKYQRTEYIVEEQPKPSEYPAWLEPRTIPLGVSRHVYIDATLVQQHAMKGQEP